MDTSAWSAYGKWGLLVPAILLLLLCIRHVRIAHLVLLCLIPLSAELHLPSGLGTDIPDEPLMWMLCLPIFVMVVRDRGPLPDTVRTHIIFRMLLVQWLWACTLIFFSSEPLLSVKFALAKAWYLLPFAAGAALFLTSRERLEHAAMALMSAMAVASIWVFCRQALDGFAFDKVNDAVRPLFRNHVNYSALLVTLLPLPVMGAIISVRYRRHFIGLTVFWLLCIFLTYSRGAWVAVPAGLITIWAVRHRLVATLALAAACVVLLLGTYLANGNRYLDHRPDFNHTVYHADLAGHIQATYRMRDLSTAERFHRWIAAVRMMDGHWLQGHGPNTFYPTYKSYVVNVFRTWVSDNRERSTVHNYFLLLLTEQGIPGLVFFVALLALMFRTASRMYHEGDDPFRRTLALTLAAMLGVIITLNVMSDLVETDKIGGLFYTVAGCLAGWSMFPGVSAAGFDVERIAQSIAKQVERQHQQHDGQAG